MILLHDGTKVSLEGVRMELVYGGMLEGIPTKEMSDRIITEAKTSFSKLWGQRACHVVDPPRTEPMLMGQPLAERYRELYPNPERLPDCMFQVWLNSWTTFDKDDDGTQVVLVFFVSKDEAANISLAELIQNASKTFVWKDVAKGFGV